ncbi:zinc finger protein 830-like [Asterias amurensis]|uniref:zinc finger protein 830-like n=1 Tax=Asterias amurensis TaxID=7602 RepID=UPI003AB4210B
MASSSKKKVDLRDLMKKQRAGSKSTATKINSPLAKYNSIGQLVCVVCNAQVKSEILWPAHLQGKKHKENLALLKHGGTPNAVQQKQPIPSLHVKSQITAKRKGDHDVTSTTTTTSAKKARESGQPSATKGLPAGFFDSEIQSSPSIDVSEKSATNSGSKTAESSALPADFFSPESSATKTTPEIPPLQEVSSSKSSNEDAKERKPSTSAEAIPEGFFDDPVMDAKVRKVEVKNTMEEEWSKFQKEMVEQNQVSENLQEEDQEAAQVDRNIDEIDEQIHCFAKVEALRDKQDHIKSEMQVKKSQHQERGKEDQEDRDVIDSDEEAEFGEFLDWRSKGAWK